jgi:L-fucose isomerase-like protein
MSGNHKKMVIGVIVGNRGFFPDHLAKSGREEILRVLQAANMEVVALTPEESKYGAVETREESRRCAELFKRNRDRIDGIIVTLPNFGEERAIADALRLADLRVPVLIQATPDDPLKMTIAFRRDSFCGKMSACNNLRQYGIPYSITTLHTESPDSPEFSRDLEWFAAVCRVVKGFRNLRVGAIGARPTAFNTVRYSEKILEAQGISIETLDLSEVLGRIARMKDHDDHAQAKLAAINKYVDASSVPAAALLKMAKLGAVVDQWMAATEVAISAVQCWTSIEENLGVVPCTVMSMMSNELLSSACEVDICGVLGMHALQLASGAPSALLDWNNNYGTDPNKAVCFHCSNLPKHFFRSVKMDFQEIIAGTVGKENTFGTCVGLIKPEKMSFARFSTDDTAGKMRGYVGQGRFTDDPLNTFGGAGVVEIGQMQKLLHYICENGFEHHVAANLSANASTVAAAVHEATTRYLDWDMYWHGRDNGAC